jgi:hypothetical protein
VRVRAPITLPIFEERKLPQPIRNVADLTELGRERLSDSFFMREMLYSEVGNFFRVSNIPEDPDLAIAAGRNLCRRILEPLRSALGQVCVRSAYRSATLNAFCSERYRAGDTACWCVDNEANYAEHIWDRRDAAGYLGATATILVPGYLDYYERTGNWRPLAWWLRDHVAEYAQIFMFPRLCAFNIRWYEGSSDQAIVYLDPPVREVLTRRDMPNFAGDHSAQYADVPSLAARTRKSR